MSSCIVYTVNSRYLLQTCLSAFQARSNTPIHLADVAIICIGKKDAVVEAASDYCAQHGILFSVAPSAVIENGSVLDARLYLDRMLADNYKDILYLDGDTQIDSSLEPILSVEMSNHLLLGCRDAMAYACGVPGPAGEKWRSYFESIGINDSIQSVYFNSGVLRFRREVWTDISRECRSYMRRKGVSFKFPDQDCLNIILNGQQSLLSLKWNYPSFFLRYKDKFCISPTILHFCSNPRPWQGPFPPWGKRWFEPYSRFARDNPALGSQFKPFTGIQSLRYNIQSRAKGLIEPSLWSNEKMRKLIAFGEQNAVV